MSSLLRAIETSFRRMPSQSRILDLIIWVLYRKNTRHIRHSTKETCHLSHMIFAIWHMHSTMNPEWCHDDGIPILHFRRVIIPTWMCHAVWLTSNSVPYSHSYIYIYIYINANGCQQQHYDVFIGSFSFLNGAFKFDENENGKTYVVVLY